MAEFEQNNLFNEIKILEALHSELSDHIDGTEPNIFNQLEIQRKKKARLILKDQIALIKSSLHPDIIA